MKKRTKIILWIIAIVVIIAAFFVKKMASDIQQENRLIAETNGVVDLLSEFSSEDSVKDNPKTAELEAKLQTTVSTGDYAVVEKTVKQYVTDFVNAVKEVETVAGDESLAKVLEPSNIKKDGPEFKATLTTLNDAITKLDILYTKFSNCFTDEDLNAYIKDKNLDEYYVNLYKKIMIDDESAASFAKDKDELLKSLEQFRTLVKQEKEVIEFLKKNKGKWQVSGDTLTFTSSSVLSQYNSLIQKITKTAEGK